MSIRSTAKALIVRDGKLLLNRCEDETGMYYAMPGGGQHQYETLFEAVVRECREETGYEVRPLRLAALCEGICTDEEFRKNEPDYAHKVYHIFLCELAGEKQGLPTEPDSVQTGSEWVDIRELGKIRLLPKIVGEWITDILNDTAPMFLGSEYHFYG